MTQKIVYLGICSKDVLCTLQLWGEMFNKFHLDPEGSYIALLSSSISLLILCQLRQFVSYI
jgi:hypothetical protein